MSSNYLLDKEQQRCYKFISSRNHSAIVAKTGTGKTLPAAKLIVQRLFADAIDTVIICAPAHGTLNWKNKLSEYYPQLAAQIALKGGMTIF